MAHLGVDVVSVVEDACVAATDAALRAGGFVPRAHIHLIVDDWDQPYVGWVETRSYCRGSDAADAISRLGDAPAAIAATRIVLAWEAADLCLPLSGPRRYPAGLAVLVASISGGHVLYWHPVDLRVAELGSDGRPIVEPAWGRPASVSEAVLPPVIDTVLARWRRLEGDPSIVFAELLADGFVVRLARR